MEYHSVVVPVEAQLEEGAGRGGALLAPEVDVDGAVGGVDDDAARRRRLRGVDLAHLA